MFDDSINEIHAAERDEARSARRALSEMDQVTACRHTGIGIGATAGCPDCGEDPR